MKHSISKAIQSVTGFSILDAFVDNSDSHARDRRSILLGHLCTGMISSITAGVYFTGLMLAMGASETYIGYVTAVVSFCGFFQIFSPLLLERIPKRKPFLMLIKIAYHLLNIVVIGIIPLLPIGDTVKLITFMAALILLNLANAAAAPGISAWHIQSIPKDKRVDFYAVNSMATTVLNQVTAFLAGLFLDHFELHSITAGTLPPTLTAIICLRVLALVIAGLECWSYSRIQESPYDHDNTSSHGLRLLTLPLKDRQFISTILIAVLWGFCASLVGQYFSIYLLENVQMSYSMISLGGFISTPLSFFATPMWARAYRHNSWLKVLSIAQFGNCIAYFLNAFITPSTLHIYFLCIILGSTFTPGLTIAHTNLLYIHMPEANRTAYISLHAIISQLCSFLGNYAGILFIQSTQTMSLRLLGFDMCNKQCINILAAVLMFGLSIYSRFYIGKRLKL